MSCIDSLGVTGHAGQLSPPQSQGGAEEYSRILSTYVILIVIIFY